MASLRNLLGAINARLPIVRTGNVGPLIVSYHGVGGLDGINVDRLDAHVAALKQARRVVPLAESVRILGQPSATQVASITFDDAYEDYVDLAVPVLQKHDLHATLFVPAGYIGRENSWDAGRRPVRKILDTRALASLDPSVSEVGIHGYSHRRLRGLDGATLHHELMAARDVVEQAVGRPARFLAYPYGMADDFDEAAERAAEACGFEAACSSVFGRGSRPSERFRLRRVVVDPEDSVQTFQHKIAGAFDWLIGKERVGVVLRRVGVFGDSP